MRIWIDTDIGTDVDDALALAYVLRHPDLELVGISTVFGDLTLRNAMIRRLLEIAGVDPSSVPLLTGLAVPMTDGRHGLMFGHEGRALLDDPEPVLRTEVEPGGPSATAERVDALAAAISAAAPDRILAIGPLTNLGAMADAGVDLPPLTIMGGKFEHDQPSGLSERPEWNWYCDPTAVQRLLALGDRLDATVVPAEVTYRTRLDDAAIARLADGDPLAGAMADLSREWLRAQREDFEFPEVRVVLHDPLAAAILVEPELCRWTQRTVTVDGRGHATVHDNDHRPNGAGSIRAATDVDPAALVVELLTRLTGSA